MAHVKLRERAEPQAAAFPIVAIGASAGGLDAVSRLLRHLPADTGMAFVLVQHLDPVHESALAQILAKTTTMAVREARNNTKVTPNSVFVIPPNTSMTISRGLLKLHARTAKPGALRSIDIFFESLAADRQARAIAIVLSGTASDGSIGVAAIKAAGGITFAQDESAMYDPMPRNAIATGCVDFVLNPEAIARELNRIARHPFIIAGAAFEGGAGASAKRGAPKNGKSLKASPGARLPAAGPKSDIKEAGYTKILYQLRNHSGVDFSLYKVNTIHRRITRRVVLNHLKNVDSYAEFLRGNAKELDALNADLLIHVTSFFRNPEAFIDLKRKVFPKLFTAGRQNPIRVWVAGCSTGQEAYSIAMVLLEFAEQLPRPPRIQVFATDLNEVLLEKARKGVYSMSIEHEMSPERLRSFFVAESSGYRISKQLRDICVFARHNLLSDPPFSRMDLVSCRNLMIYLAPNPQEKIVQTLQYALVPNGFLFLGASESVGASTELFDVVDKKHKIFAKRGGMMPPIRRLDAAQSVASKQAEPASRTIKPHVVHPVELTAEREADRVTLGTFAPPAVLINSALQIIQFRGLTGEYLEPPPGKASYNILKMAREGLARPLRAAIVKAKKDNRNVLKSNVEVRSKGTTRTIDLEVVPLKNLKEVCYLVFFQPRQPGKPAPPGESRQGKFRREETLPQTGGSLRARRASHLERELAEMHDYLEAVQEQNEAANEELQAANEEVTSANEELQSINEELETSKEELESTNEELTTVNEEMNHRNIDLTRLNNDLNNFYASVDMAIVRLDRGLRIQNYTPPAEKLLNFVSADVGRSISAIKHNLNIPDLETLLMEVIDTVSVRQRELQDANGHWYSLRMRPYVTIDKKIDGVVLILVDIDELKRHQHNSQQLLDYTQAVIQAVPPLVVLSDQLQVRTVNRSFCTKFGVQQEDVANHSIYEMGAGQWNFPELRKLLEDTLATKAASRAEVAHGFKGIGKRTLVLSTSHVEFQSKHNILLCVDDITERKVAEETLIAANKSKDEFLATLAHELRNPLAPIQNSIEIMAHAKGDPSTLEDCRHRIQRQMSKMVQLVDDLLDISRISRGKLVLRKRNIDLKTVIDEVIDTCRAMPCAPREISVKLPHDPIYLDADPLRLNQIIGNLLNNACKYTDAGGKIAVVVEREDGVAVIRVRDTGIGIEKEMLSRIFDIFTQIDHSLERTHGGLGLGLAIVNRMVQMHGGTVEAHSPGLNKGSEFVVRIPVVDRAKPPSSATLPAVPSPEPVKFTKRKVLIADDNIDSAESLSMLLKLDGHEVRTAFDGVEALATAEQFRPDVILLDIGMPRLNGFDTAREIRKTNWGCDAVLLALTGWGQEQDRRTALEAGFNHLLVKPADIAELRRVVTTMKGNP